MTQQNYQNQCVGVPWPWNNMSIWTVGGGASPGGVLEVLGGGGGSNHLLWAAACLPWASECFNVVANDVLGLCWNPSCGWGVVSGSLLGYGSGSAATFPPGVTMATTVSSVACSPSSPNVIPFHPFPPPLAGLIPDALAPTECPQPSSIFWNGGPTINAAGTIETNNLTPAIPVPAQNVQYCFQGTCWVTYTASD